MTSRPYQAIIKRSYAVFRPHAMHYPGTFDNVIRSVSMPLICNEDPEIHNSLMEDVIQVTRPFCDIEARKWRMHTLNHNCKRQWFNTSDVSYVYEALLPAARRERETRLLEPTDALRPLYAMVNRSKINSHHARHVKSRFVTLLPLHV